MTARDALLYGPGLSVPQEIGQFFSLVVKILEPCSTTWYFRHFQFGIDMASGFSVRIGSETITTSRVGLYFSLVNFYRALLLNNFFI